MGFLLIKRTCYTIVFSFFLAGCQPKVYLMPPPVGISPDARIFDFSKENEDENLLYTLYGTNRIPVDATQRDTKYTIFPSNTLRLGFVVDRIGEERMSWEEVVDLSLQKDRDEDLLVEMVHSREMSSYHLTADLNQYSYKERYPLAVLTV
jgi:hypothetical protein